MCISTKAISEALDSSSVDIRLEAAESLIDSIVEIRDALETKLAEEKNELVLLNLLEAVELFGGIDDSFEVLVDFAKQDRRPLIRAFATSCLPNYDNHRAADVLVELLATEKNRRVLVDVYVALYRIGNRGIFGEILK